MEVLKDWMVGRESSLRPDTYMLYQSLRIWEDFYL